jgi:hypothetical protein
MSVSSSQQQQQQQQQQQVSHDEFDEVEESLLSYKRFTKRLRHTIVNPFFIGASFAVGLSIG